MIELQHDTFAFLFQTWIRTQSVKSLSNGPSGFLITMKPGRCLRDSVVSRSFTLTISPLRFHPNGKNTEVSRFRCISPKRCGARFLETIIRSRSRLRQARSRRTFTKYRQYLIWMVTGRWKSSSARTTYEEESITIYRCDSKKVESLLSVACGA